MRVKSNFQPPHTITPEILNQVAAISESVGRLTVISDQAQDLRTSSFYPVGKSAFN